MNNVNALDAKLFTCCRTVLRLPYICLTAGLLISR